MSLEDSHTPLVERHSPLVARSTQSNLVSCCNGHSNGAAHSGVRRSLLQASNFMHVRGQVLRIQNELPEHSPSVAQYLPADGVAVAGVTTRRGSAASDLPAISFGIGS